MSKTLAKNSVAVLLGRDFGLCVEIWTGALQFFHTNLLPSEGYRH